MFFASRANQVGRKHFYLVQQSPMHALIYLMQDQRRQRKAEIFRELEVRQSIFYSFQPLFSAFSTATKYSEMMEKEKHIPIELWMRSQNSSGFSTIVRQILGHLDFNSLINCRLVSKSFKNFLEDETFWITFLNQVSKEYLEKLKEMIQKAKCPEFYIMSPEEIKDDYNSWTTILEILKTKGSIEDLINFTKLLKQAEDLIQCYGNFFPIERTYSFRNAGYGYRIAGFEKENVVQMKLLKNNLSSEMVKENRIISPKISPHCDTIVILLVSYYRHSSFNAVFWAWEKPC